MRLPLGALALVLSVAAPAAVPAHAALDTAPDTVAAKRPCTAVAFTTLQTGAPPEAAIDSAMEASPCRRVQWIRRGFIIPATAADSIADLYQPRIRADTLPDYLKPGRVE